MGRPKAFDEDEVLAKAVNLFWCRGYEATSVQDVVDELGINRASLYDTFGDKYQLYRKALDRYRQANQSGLCALLDQARPAADILRELFANTIRESIDDVQQKGCFMVNAAIERSTHDPEIARVVAENQRAFEGKLAVLIERGQHEGAITTSFSAADLARFVYSTLNGLKVLSKIQPDASALESVVTIAMRSLINENR